MKKLFALLLAAVMSASLLTGCGQKEAPAASAPVASTPAASAPAEDDLGGYPDHNISWIVCMAAGSGTDLAVRQLVDMVDLGADISVENVTGGSQTVGINDGLSRGGDGYTIISMANAGIITQPIMNPDVGFGLDDLKMIAMLTPECTATITVAKDSPLNTYEDWVEFVTTNEDFTYALTATGGYGQLGILNVLKQLGAPQGTGASYDGGAGAYQALINGETDFAILDDNAVYQNHENGEVKVLGTIYSERSYYLPDVPALSEFGLKDLDVLGGWKFIAVSAETPDNIVNYISEKLMEGLESEEYNQAMINSGFGAFDYVMAGDELTELLEKTAVFYEEILTEYGMM